MSMYENARAVTAKVRITNGVAAALRYRFCTFDPAGAESREVITHVPGATGAAARGILSMKPDTANVKNGVTACPMVVPDGGIALVELGEAVTDLAVPLRIGGNAGEVDGAAYLANATGDVIVAFPLTTGSVGNIIPVQFVGYAGVAP